MTALSRHGRAALWYAQRGLRVHPLRRGTKLPVLAAWPERATVNLGIIAGWWRRSPYAGIGIATGATSGVIVFDNDPRHGGDSSLAALEREHGKMPSTWRCLTAGGGLHLYFRHPGDHVGNRTGLWRGIDLRGDGGYVVAPPTALTDGRGYAWEVGYGPHEAALADTPTWLLARLHDERGGGQPPRIGVAGPGDPIAAGKRNATLTSLAGVMRHRGMSAEAMVAALLVENRTRCEPPLPESEVARIAASVARYAPGRSVASQPRRFLRVVVR